MLPVERASGATRRARLGIGAPLVGGNNVPHGAFSPHARRSGSARRGKGWAVIQGPGANPHGGHYVHIPESTKGKESDGLRAHIITLKAGG